MGIMVCKRYRLTVCVTVPLLRTVFQFQYYSHDFELNIRVYVLSCPLNQLMHSPNIANTLRLNYIKISSRYSVKYPSKDVL